MKSTFTSDLQKERRLQELLDSYYEKYLQQYRFKRIEDLDRQFQGIDVIFCRKTDDAEFLIDEKAQLDYINDDLPTFAFELSYLKNGNLKEGWLFDNAKKTDFYALATAIYSDEPGLYTSCKITMVNREKLLSFLQSRELGPESFKNRGLENGKIAIDELDSKTEGYLYFSKKKKAEKPLNLILKLDFLIRIGVAKRLI